jgi:hypothetical protein
MRMILKRDHNCDLSNFYQVMVHCYITYIHTFSSNFARFCCFISPWNKVVPCDIRKHLKQRVSQEERSVFWEVIVSVILSKNVYMYMGPNTNGFRDRVISPYSSYHLHRGTSRYTQMSNTPCPYMSCKVH